MIYLEIFLVIYLIKISYDIPGNIYCDIPHKISNDIPGNIYCDIPRKDF